MPITEKTQPGEPMAANSSASQIARDERLGAMVSAYLDGELMGTDLEEFEALLHSNEDLAREVADMRRIELQLTELGSDILSEPIPDSLLDALSHLPGSGTPHR